MHSGGPPPLQDGFNNMPPPCAKLPSPKPSRMETVPGVEHENTTQADPATTRSNFPSPFTSVTRISVGYGTSAYCTIPPYAPVPTNVPSPLPRRTDTESPE